jgi:branched-chain amino acid transport system ATP-binding protein
MPQDTEAVERDRARLSVEDLVKRFRGLRALDGVSLHVDEGEIVGLIGPNGSGKTTLLNVASGVMRPTSGRVTVDGVDATGRKPHDLAHLGIGRTFQQIRLFAEMTVEENVEVGAVARAHDRERVPELLDRLGLTADSDRFATTLPYGQQRRVEIARALAGRPRFLLLDEPGAGMNEVESDALLATIRQVRDDEGCAVLIVDHDLRLILRLCERIHVLAEGKTICEGTAEEVRHDPAVIQAYLGTAGAVAAGDETERTRPVEEEE